MSVGSQLTSILSINVQLFGKRGMQNSPVRYSSLSAQILQILTERIHSGTYPPESLLPTENQLATEFRVSRATIRSALDRLAAMDLILRRQGIGTFVRRRSHLSNLLNRFIDFFDLISSNGFQPSFQQLGACLLEASAEQVRDLKLEQGSRLLVIEKAFYADEDPIIFCINRIPEWVFRNFFTPDQVIQPGLTEPLFTFFEHTCQQPIDYYISSVRAEVLRNCQLPSLFHQKDPLTPVLIIDEIGYNQEDRPIHQSIEYHPGNCMNFQLFRSRSG